MGLVELQNTKGNVLVFFHDSLIRTSLFLVPKPNGTNQFLWIICRLNFTSFNLSLPISIFNPVVTGSLIYCSGPSLILKSCPDQCTTISFTSRHRFATFLFRFIFSFENSSVLDTVEEWTFVVFYYFT